MKFQNTFSPVHQQVFVGIFLLLLLVAGEADAQKKKSRQPNSYTGYGHARYTPSSFGKPMLRWLIAGPALLKEENGSKPEEAKQSAFFDNDLITEVPVVADKAMAPIKAAGNELSWFSHTAEQDVINFDLLFQQADFAAGYALAEVQVDSSLKTFLALGSDDALKVWLNGSLVHSIWSPRGVVPDQDVIPLQLQKGSNQLLIKVQDIEGEWGFTARFLDKDALSDRLVVAAGKGQLDELDLLLTGGADVNKVNAQGLTALNAAKLAGRQEVIAILQQNGAVETPMPAPEVLADQLFSSLQKEKAPGIAVLVSKGGKVLYKKGFGYANIKKKELVGPETKFRIGSNTKQFVAASILKLQEEGKLSVTDKLSNYFPDFPQGEKVTIHHLLTHTSGIHSYTNKPDFITKVTKPVRPEDLVAAIQHDPYDFPPGTAYSYNNSGYFLAGLIVEKVSGKSLDQYLKDTFFTPLQMQNTGIHTPSLKLTKEAIGYAKEGTAYAESLNWDMSWAGGAGALYSTVDDLFLWNEALYGGKVLSEASLEAALTPVVLNDGSIAPAGGKGYGYGLMMNSYRNQDVILHGGGLNGFISQLARYPKEDLSVVLLTNVTPTEQHLDPNTLAEYFLWESMEPQASLKILAIGNMDLQKYAGRYDMGNGMVMTITADSAALWAQLSGQGRFQIFPSGPDEFFWKVVDAKVKFISDGQGQVTHGQFQQNGMDIKVQRLKEEKIVAVDPSIFETFKGKYDFGNNFTIQITKEGNRMFAQATNNPKVELLPLSEKEFFAKEFNVRFLFQTAPDTPSTTLTVDIGGQKMQATKGD